MATGPRTLKRRRGRGRLAVVLATLITLLGCAETRAPVVDKPVWDEPPSRAARAPSPRPNAPAPGGEPESGDWRPGTYTVRRGDTLYSIALDYGLDYRELAQWNELGDPNVIRVGQTLSLRAPAGWKSAPMPDQTEAVAQPLTSAPQVEGKALAPLVVKNAPKGVKVAYSDQALAQLRGEPFKTVPAPRPASAPSARQEPARPAPTEKSAPGTAAAGAPAAAAAPAGAASSASAWIWPARGPLLHGFNQGSNPKGVAIGGQAGEPVIASAAGKVVYSGSGLRGYGKLIIIKHSDEYLSVYAHNRVLLVKEGERVTKGQKIAEMGSSGAERVALHFEIRRLGKPVDPLKYLPEGGAS